MGRFTWTDPGVATRWTGNPLLSAKDMPYPSTLVYNPGVTKFNGRYVMLLRNLHYSVPWTERTHFLGWATSDDGIHWDVDPDARFHVPGLSGPADPRLTVIDGRCYVCVSESSDGLCGAIAVSDDLRSWELLSISAPDNRNMVLFPERVNGNFIRFERPFRSYDMPRHEYADMWLSESPDGRYWGKTRIVLRVDEVPFCNVKLGAAGQPIRTDSGWLTLFHATHDDPETLYPTWRNEDWHRLYCAGVMMLDLEDPSKIIGMSRVPLMVPREPYETDGYRSATIFPTGTFLEPDGTVKIYYGACDTSICLATARLSDLVDLCEPV